MERMKFAVLGLGNFGHGWATRVFLEVEDIAELVAVIDKNTDRFSCIPNHISRYSNLEEAINNSEFDAVINVTPPHLHTGINKFLLSKGIHVLCEKPISDKLEDARDMLQYCRDNNTTLMISENYRFKKIIREGRRLIADGMIGKVHSIKCDFSHYHPDCSKFYHGALSHPLLMDVSIHHLDLARYICCSEPLKVYCKEWDASYSWYNYRLANVFIWTDMDNGIRFQYTGSLATHVSSTDWYGTWLIEGEKGNIRIEGDELQLLLKDSCVPEKYIITSNHEDSRVDVLREFVEAYNEKRSGETCIEDNFKTFLWLVAAMQSSETNKEVSVTSILTDI